MSTATTSILTPSRLGGLGLDARVLVEELAAVGRSARTVKLLDPQERHGAWSQRSPTPCDLSFSLENPVEEPPGRRNVLIPNPEWFRLDWLPLLLRYDVVAAKTRAAFDAFVPHHPRVRHISFRTPDHPYRADVTAATGFLLVAGKSRLRETQRLVDVWGAHPEWPTLTLIAGDLLPSECANVVVVRPDYRDRDVIGRAWRANPFHFCLSLTEGWGHYALESAASGAVLLRPDHPPFDEILPGVGLPVPSERCTGLDVGLARCYTARDSGIETAVEAAIAMSTDDRRTAAAASRAAFDATARAFPKRFRGLVAELDALP